MYPGFEPFTWKRRPTREVRVGDVGIGGGNPIRVQSMTTPATSDVAATTAQIARLARAGCEIVRLTVPTSRDAEALPLIRAALAREGIRVPLVADIHFSPAAALKAVEHVEKVRINPGNYADRKKFAVFEISDADYAAELERIEQAVRPLVRRAKELGVALRIGTNHGSLSDRVLNRYGDTPLGMVESALEFVRICEAHGLRDVVVSMKSSNPLVMVQAYRLLAARMAAEGMDHPFHLGVTEAGDGEEGRIKSAIGIGALLEEGIGDTVRVSLTEDPVAEVPVAFGLVGKFNRWIAGEAAPPAPVVPRRAVFEKRNPFSTARRACRAARFGPVEIGGDRPVGLEVFLGGLGGGAGRIEELARRAAEAAGAGLPEEERADLVEVALESEEEAISAAELRAVLNERLARCALSLRVDSALLHAFPALAPPLARAADRLALRLPPPEQSPPRAERVAELLARALGDSGAGLLVVGRGPGPEPPRDGGPDAVVEAVERVLAALAAARDAGLARLAAALDAATFAAPVGAVRLLLARLDARGLGVPVVLLEDAAGRGEDPLLGSSSVAGALLCDGIGDSVQIAAARGADARRLALGILQGSRVRITRTEFISCPSCGRTQFDLETTTRRIKQKTSHLKGVRIAIMGCIVNGPGEMADADFGYVGWGKNRVSLFVGKEMVEKDIPTEEADTRLIDLIRRHGRWTDPPRCSIP